FLRVQRTTSSNVLNIPIQTKFVNGHEITNPAEIYADSILDLLLNFYPGAEVKIPIVAGDTDINNLVLNLPSYIIQLIDMDKSSIIIDNNQIRLDHLGKNESYEFKFFLKDVPNLNLSQSEIDNIKNNKTDSGDLLMYFSGANLPQQSILLDNSGIIMAGDQPTLAINLPDDLSVIDSTKLPSEVITFYNYEQGDVVLQNLPADGYLNYEYIPPCEVGYTLPKNGKCEIKVTATGEISDQDPSDISLPLSLTYLINGTQKTVTDQNNITVSTLTHVAISIDDSNMLHKPNTGSNRVHVLFTNTGPYNWQPSHDSSDYQLNGNNLLWDTGEPNSCISSGVVTVGNSCSMYFDVNSLTPEQDANIRLNINNTNLVQESSFSFSITGNKAYIEWFKISQGNQQVANADEPINIGVNNQYIFELKNAGDTSLNNIQIAAADFTISNNQCNNTTLNLNNTCQFTISSTTEMAVPKVLEMTTGTTDSEIHNVAFKQLRLVAMRKIDSSNAQPGEIITGYDGLEYLVVEDGSSGYGIKNPTILNDFISGNIHLATSLVTDMQQLFQNQSTFNLPLESWDVSNVQNFQQMFEHASSFNQPLESWDVSKATNFNQMFHHASSFNQPLNAWNTEDVTDMFGMFGGAISFNQPLSNWNTENVTNMGYMFRGATAFNQSLTTWNTSQVTQMNFMFNEASDFNGAINGWDVSNVQDFSQMFHDASSFNQSLSNWSTGSATNMFGMFSGTSSFNQPLSNWNTGNVTTMAYMFNNASSFDQDISGWNVGNVTDHSGFDANTSTDWISAEKPSF
ncbi:BspA family leucine-rich repeat surface protein, partial [Cysteiniphilum halobium]|uniref:BspA family leucine-rich repeat surface protein n=1 Tax=Cysteiniphilum halobium TaxID=2219059 RepID=UPI000E64FFB4